MISYPRGNLAGKLSLLSHGYFHSNYDINTYMSSKSKMSSPGIRVWSREQLAGLVLLPEEKELYLISAGVVSPCRAWVIGPSELCSPLERAILITRSLTTSINNSLNDKERLKLNQKASTSIDYY